MTRLSLPQPTLAKPVIEYRLEKPWRTHRQQGITLPVPGRIVVLYWVGKGDQVLPDLRVHELEGHALLFAHLPWWRALGGYVWRWIRAGFSYEHHPDEVFARIVQARVQPDWAYGIQTGDYVSVDGLEGTYVAMEIGPNNAAVLTKAEVDRLQRSGDMPPAGMPVDKHRLTKLGGNVAYREGR